MSNLSLNLSDLALAMVYCLHIALPAPIPPPQCNVSPLLNFQQFSAEAACTLCTVRRIFASNYKRQVLLRSGAILVGPSPGQYPSSHFTGFGNRSAAADENVSKDKGGGAVG